MELSGQGQKPLLAFGRDTTTAPDFGSSSQSSNFGKPSVPAFGQPSAHASTFGKSSSSSFGQPSALGQAGTLGRPATSFGQPPAAFGHPSASTPQFGQSSGPSSFGTALQKPSPFGPPSGPSTTTQPLSTANQTNNPFGQPSGSEQPGLFGQTSAPLQSNVVGRPPGPNSANPFGQRIESPSQKTTGELTHAAPTSFGQNSKTKISFANRPVPTFGFSLESLISSRTPVDSANVPTVQSATSNGLASVRTSTEGPSAGPIIDKSLARISTWKGQPVSYIDDEPCYKDSDGNWRKIWFSHGPPVFTKTPQMPEENYNVSIKDVYSFAKEHGVFKNGVMPEVPPKREWCDWDF